MGTDYDFATVAYDAATGVQMWVSRYVGPGYDWPHALAVGPDGASVFVTGSSSGTGSTNLTVAYDASTGSQTWATPSYGTAFALAVSPDGSRVFVTGLGFPIPVDYETLAYDASTGKKIWSKRYNGSANGGDVARGLGVSPDGATVYVSGYSEALVTGADYRTIAYKASTGSKVWSRRYNDPQSLGDIAMALAVNPNGSAVYVTGSAPRSTTRGVDYTTVAYGTA